MRGSPRLDIVIPAGSPRPEDQEKTMLRRWAAGLAVTAAAAGALVLGGGTALADAPPSDHANSAICTQRIPAVLARIDKVTNRINGDASVKGSTAWLRAKADKARAAGYPALADLLTARAGDRPGRLDELTKLRSDVEHVKATDCAA
jgi:hypothetical protein